jgi:hypothetical protein
MLLFVAVIEAGGAQHSKAFELNSSNTRQGELVVKCPQYSKQPKASASHVLIGDWHTQLRVYICPAVLLNKDYAASCSHAQEQLEQKGTTPKQQAWPKPACIQMSTPFTGSRSDK